VITPRFKFALRIMLSGLIGLSLMACDPRGSVDGKVSAARTRNDAPPIWIIKDVDSTLYLYGTVHLLPPEIDWQHEDMRRAFDSSGTIFFEVASDRKAQLEASVLTHSLGFYKNGQRLSDQLDSYQLKLLEAAANNGNVSLAALESMKPWLASEFLTLAAATEHGLSPDISADEALKSRARRLQKNVIYLDTIESQIRLSADQAEFVQMTILSEVLSNFNRLGPDAKRASQAWSIGQTEFLTQEIIKPAKLKSPDMYQALFSDRNANWVRTLTPFLDGSGTGFVAVGIGHLLGEDSLQTQFRNQGYDVKRYRAFQGEPVIRPAFTSE